MSSEEIFANGINGLTGHYLFAPTRLAELASAVGQSLVSTRQPVEAFWRQEARLGLPRDRDPRLISDVGWGIVFASEEEEAVRVALAPLVEHRSAVSEGRTLLLDHRPDEDHRAWLARHRVAPGTLNPERVPYYLLLVGPPSRIPFAFQYLLDVEYAVGRIDFDDVDGYERYAQALLNHERRSSSEEAAVTLFATEHPGDPATTASVQYLMKPLLANLPTTSSSTSRRGVHSIIGPQATKQVLSDIFTAHGRGRQPSLLFSATHGVGGWPIDHPDQRLLQGALLCQDWPGIGRIDADHYFAGRDLADDIDLKGMIAFFFACYSAGTPEFDSYPRRPGRPLIPIARAPFVAQLPKEMLKRGALAVIGHVDRAWGYSFHGSGEPQLMPFENALGRIVEREPVGYAMKDFNERFASLSANLVSSLEDLRLGRMLSDSDLTGLWTEKSDAQNFLLFGDPATRL